MENVTVAKAVIVFLAPSVSWTAKILNKLKKTPPMTPNMKTKEKTASWAEVEFEKKKDSR